MPGSPLMAAVVPIDTVSHVSFRTDASNKARTENVAGHSRALPISRGTSEWDPNTAQK